MVRDYHRCAGINPMYSAFSELKNKGAIMVVSEQLKCRIIILNLIVNFEQADSLPPIVDTPPTLPAIMNLLQRHPSTDASTAAVPKTD